MAKLSDAIPCDLSRDPHAGAIKLVVTAAIFDEDNRVLLFKRKKPPYEGYWELVGGGLEFGEALERGIRREVLEETGIGSDKIKRLVFVGHFEHLMKPDYHRILFNFACRVATGTRVVMSEHEQYGWFKLDALPSPLIPFVGEEIKSGARTGGILL